MELIAEKQRKKKQFAFKFKLYLSISVFLFAIVFFLYLLIYSPIFKIKNIDSSQTNLSQADIEKIIEDYKLFLIGQSKVKAILGANNILIWGSLEGFFNDHPQIAEFSIDKDYITRELKIRVNGRQRLGIWCLKSQIANNCWWFDKEGIAFESAPSVEGEIIYKINDFSERRLNFGERVVSVHLFQNIIKIFDVLDKSGIKIKTFKLSDLNFQEISTESSYYPKIYFSLRFNPTFSLSTLKNLSSIGWQKIEYIDLRVENRAYYKLK